MIVNETVNHKHVKHQIQRIKHLQVTVRPSTMDKNPYRKVSCKMFTKKHDTKKS